jgi:hypothetical protein
LDVEFIGVSRKNRGTYSRRIRQLTSLKGRRRRTVRDAEVPVVFTSGDQGKAR